MCWFLQPLPPFPSQTPSGWAPQIPLQFQGHKIRMWAPPKLPTMLGGLLVVSIGYSFPAGEIRGSGKTSALCPTGLGEGQYGQRIAAILTLLMQFVLISVVQGVLRPHHHVLEFSESCLVFEYLLVLFVQGSKVRKTYVFILVMSLPSYM